MPARPRRRVAALAFSVTCLLVAFFLGERYISRLPNHAGYFLVPVADDVRVPLHARPRHTAFIVVDGLRRDAAETMNVTRVLERAGQCRISDQGSFTVSRPEYALLSTGLEVDRTGSRNNDLTTPLAAESIWQVAREGGLRVSGSSHLRWFQQLFPQGFDRFTQREHHGADVFAPDTGELLDVNVFHPLYVDEKAHHYGAASPEYAAAVARVDGEIAGLLARMDLSQDLVVLTSDHGHRDAGGHGGAQPEIKDVLVCFAGRGVSTRTDRAAFDGRSTAPALALLLGVRFPRHMRAGDDGLDVLWDVMKAEPSLEAYRADRRAAVEHFRAQNRVALERWLGGPPGTWPRLYAREAQAQAFRATVVALLTALWVTAVLRARRMRTAEIARLVPWLASSLLLVWAVHHAVLGDLDFTVINLRGLFVPRAALVALLSSLVSLGVHRLLLRSPARRLGDLLLLMGLVLAANLGHVFVYGWPLGFPLPSQPARYFPFFGAILLAVQAVVALGLAELEHRRAQRSSG